MIAPVSIFKSVFCLFYHKPTLSVATTLYTLLCPVPYTSSPDVPLATPSNHWQMMYNRGTLCLYCTTLKWRTWPTARCQDKISSVCGHICENVNFLKFIKLICLEKYGDPPIKGTLWNNKEKKNTLYFWIGEGQNWTTCDTDSRGFSFTRGKLALRATAMTLLIDNFHPTDIAVRVFTLHFGFFPSLPIFRIGILDILKY